MDSANSKGKPSQPSQKPDTSKTYCKKRFMAASAQFVSNTLLQTPRLKAKLDDVDIHALLCLLEARRLTKPYRSGQETVKDIELKRLTDIMQSNVDKIEAMCSLIDPECAIARQRRKMDPNVRREINHRNYTAILQSHNIISMRFESDTQKLFLSFLVSTFDASFKMQTLIKLFRKLKRHSKANHLLIPAQHNLYNTVMDLRALFMAIFCISSAD